MPKKLRPALFRWVGVLGVALALLVFILSESPKTDMEATDFSPLEDAASEGERSPADYSNSGTSGSNNATSPVYDSGEVLLTEELNRLLDSQRRGISREDLKGRMAALKKLVHATEPASAAKTIISALRSGEDSATGLAYVIGAEGVMTECPTYRTTLLDLLGQTDPFQSSAFSRELMSGTSTPDEYSLALRNLAWANVHGRLDDELEDRFGTMVERQEWRNAPTPGYLEAFDVAAATGSVARLANIMESARMGLESEELIGRAAFIALDRLMIADPTRVVSAFRKDPALLSKTPTHRASILSRLDIRQTDQAALLADYLQRPDHADGEMEYFAEIFPNGNYFSSYRLVTPWQSGLNMGQVAELDRATEQILRQWKDEPAFAASREHLQAIIARLGELDSESVPSDP